MNFAGRRHNEALDHALVLEPLYAPAQVRADDATTFTQREWTIISLARRDSMASVQPDTRLARVFRRIFGIERANPLSDDRLEALRRIAVLTWHEGYNVPSSEIAAFLETGFSERQYELVAGHIVAELAASRGLRR